jgi:NADH-quinone oxidoreductase subunit H
MINLFRLNLIKVFIVFFFLAGIGFFFFFNIFWILNLLKILFIILLVIPILLVIAFYTLAERKIMGAIQRRRGPNVVGFWGLLQPLADGIKLVLKEPIFPRKSNKNLFILAPVITFVLAISMWAIVPFSFYSFLTDNVLSLLLVFAISSLSIFGIIGAGWASNSKYALLGSLRSAAQMISYEISLGFIFLTIVLLNESANLLDIYTKQFNCNNFFPLFPLVLIFFIAILAETNRAPFDLPEAEAEIVAGYNIEYSGVLFALFFLGEYSNMFIMSILFILLFFGGPLLFSYYSLLIFCIKILIVSSSFIVVRAVLPRVRYDQLMYIGWEIFLPICLVLILYFFYN